MAVNLKAKITRKARQLGADLVGYAQVSRWAAQDEVAPAFRPEAIWSQAKSVIVLGVPMLLPIIESTPSINYTVMYDTTNALLDMMGYQLALYLNGLGHASIFMPRDGYGSLEILKKRMAACFSQVYAGKYAGLGNALEKGDVDAWAGLDPLLAQTEVDKGSRLFYRDPDKNTYGVLNVREAFAKQYPAYVGRVILASVFLFAVLGKATDAAVQGLGRRWLKRGEGAA
jgi:hypothetical protein